MKFYVYAGSIYCGKLYVFNRLEAFFPVNHEGLFFSEARAKVRGYKKLSLQRFY